MNKAFLFVALLLTMCASLSAAYAAVCTTEKEFSASANLPSGATPTKLKVLVGDHHGSDFDVTFTTGTTNAASATGTAFTDEKVEFSAAISYDASTGVVSIVVSEEEPSSGSMIKSSMGNIVTSIAACSYLASENPSKKAIFSVAAAYGLMTLTTASAACDFKADVAVTLPVGYTAAPLAGETDAAEGIYVYTLSGPTSSPTTAAPTTLTPTTSPTAPTTKTPTDAPTNAPTKQPSATPTNAPTKQPSATPTKAPTEVPSTTPTKQPSATPTKAPTDVPSTTPTKAPTEVPSTTPTKQPTASPV